MCASHEKRRIVVGIGNTSINLGLVDNQSDTCLPEISKHLMLRTRERRFDSIGPWSPPGEAHWYVASVQRELQHELKSWLSKNRPNDEYTLLTHEDVPLALDVLQPERVGMDRLAAAVAANRLRSPTKSAIVVDAGTAITVDAVDARGTFLGGTIMPGIELAARALCKNTDQLPLVTADPSSLPPVIGRFTEQAIQSGLVWGTVGALKELIERIRRELSGDCELFFTGGDADKLAHLVDGPGKFVPHLVLLGIAVTASGDV